MTKVDPITLEVFRNRFDAIAQEMQNTLLRSAYSIILKEGGDCSCALFSHAGEVIAQAASNPSHLSAFGPATERILAKYPADRMVPGDVFILNDPYDGGTHVPDIVVVVPVFHDGAVVALGCALGHQQDMGGQSPGSMPADATDIFQEGLVVPPERLYRAGQINETLTAFIARNVRIPEQVFGDIAAEVAAGKTAASRVQQLIEQHGIETFREVVPALMDHAERLTRQELEKIPDGVYEFTDYVDNDGIDLDRTLEIRVRVTIRGSDMHVDFAGTSPQARGPANCAPGTVLGPVYYAVRALTGSHIPNNSGCFRPVTVSASKGSLVWPERPAPVSIRYHTLKRIVDALLGALAPALPKVPAASHGSDLCMSWGGVDPLSREHFVYMECTTGGTGGTWAADGIDQLGSNLGNSKTIPAEAAEIEHPVRIWANRLRTDSGGAGRFRGGLGVERVVELLRGEVTVSHRSDRHYTPPWGLRGGRPGARWTTLVRRAGGAEEIMPGRKVFALGAGDRVVALTGGGGGYGPPWERDPAQVAADVRDRKVSPAAARDQYGVVLDGAGAVDAAATAARRRAMAEAAGGEPPLVDRGVRGLGVELRAGPGSPAAQDR
jgi:N-methylhydantoinase B